MKFAPLSALLTAASLIASCSGEVVGPMSPFGNGTANSIGGGSGGNGSNGGTGGTGTKGNGGSNIAGTSQPLDCKQSNVAATPLQRLSSEQYINSVRDLLGVPVDSNALPQDEKVGVFDGNVLVPVSGLTIDSYMAVAEATAKAAVPTIEKVVPCDRTKLGDVACSTTFIKTFGRRAYRRPLTDAEVAAYQAIYTAYKAPGYPDALRVIVQTMLQSPHFLYRVELIPASANAPVTKLSAYELAARLSFFLVSTTPDETLLAAAESGDILDDDGVQTQIDRLLADARFTDTTDSFHTQWLDLTGLDSMTRDATLFPGFTSDTPAAMRKETLRFANYVLTKDDAKLETLLTASYSFPEGPLVGLYGLKAGVAADGEPVKLDPKQRAGLLTQPSFLASHAHYNQSAPVQRGKVMIRNILCQVLPDPPPNVNTVPPDPSPTLTVRQQLEVHTADASCAGCHQKIDGIGLGFEQFDAIGAFRSTENSKPVDSTGEIFGTDDSDGTFDGVPELAQKLVDSTEVQHCVTAQWVRFALGRLEGDADACTLDSLNKDFASTGFDIKELLRAIVLSDAFRSKRVVAEVSP